MLHSNLKKKKIIFILGIIFSDTFFCIVSIKVLYLSYDCILVFDFRNDKLFIVNDCFINLLKREKIFKKGYCCNNSMNCDLRICTFIWNNINFWIQFGAIILWILTIYTRITFVIIFWTENYLIFKIINSSLLVFSGSNPKGCLRGFNESFSWELLALIFLGVEKLFGFIKNYQKKFNYLTSL